MVASLAQFIGCKCQHTLNNIHSFLSKSLSDNNIYLEKITTVRLFQITFSALAQSIIKYLDEFFELAIYLQCDATVCFSNSDDTQNFND